MGIADKKDTREMTPVPLMTPDRARDIGRAYKGWGNYLQSQGLVVEADHADHDAQWWIAYAVALAQTNQKGASDER
jgi:hypothetical protein